MVGSASGVNPFHRKQPKFDVSADMESFDDDDDSEMNATEMNGVTDSPFAGITDRGSFCTFHSDVQHWAASLILQFGG